MTTTIDRALHIAGALTLLALLAHVLPAPLGGWLLMTALYTLLAALFACAASGCVV